MTDYNNPSNETLEAGFWYLIKERLKSPYVWLFLISWLFFNWRGVFYIFDMSLPLENRLEIIDKKYSSIWPNLIYPFFSSLAAYYLIDYILWFTEWGSSHGKRIRKEVAKNQAISDITLETKIDEAKYNQLIASERYKNLQARMDEIDLLTRNNEKLAIENRELISRLKEASFGLHLQSENEYLNELVEEWRKIIEYQAKENDQNQFLFKNIRDENFQKKVNIFFNSLHKKPDQLPKDLLNFISSNNFIEKTTESENTRIFLTNNGIIFLFLYIEWRANEKRKKRLEEIKKLTSLESKK